MPPRIPPTLAIAGPTASGKSAAALHVAARLQARGQAVEIVSVDSALVYRGMDIGTAKPTRQERAVCPHHLIDVRDPAHPWSAADFVRAAHDLLPQIHARGALALLVGGTMLYYQALLHGLDDMPPASLEARQQLEREAAEHGWPALHAQLARVDPQTASRLAPQDRQRIQRALEVWRISGRPLSAFHAGRPVRAAPDSGLMAAGGFFSLEPAGRAWLDQRIAQRLDAMLAAGLVDEVRALRARGDLHAALPAMRCVGYRQVWQMLDAPGQADAGPDIGALHGRIYRATRQLAKRQMTWLRAMPWRQVFACEDDNLKEHISQSIFDFIDSSI